MVRTVRAEWFCLARRRVLVTCSLVAALFGIGVTAVMMITLGESANPLALDERLLERAEGATMPIGAGMAFGSIAVFAVFVALSAGGYANGTFRVALLHEPRRLAVAGGQLVARWALVSSMLAATLFVGSATALALAPSQGVETTAWFSAAGLADLVGDTARIAAFTFGWALFGTLVGVLSRSIPVGLAAGLMWAGPVENVLGDELDFAPVVG